MKKVCKASILKTEDINDNFDHLSASVTGINKRLKILEDDYKDLIKIAHSTAGTAVKLCSLVDDLTQGHKRLQEQHESITDAVVLIGEELDMVEHEEEAHAG